MGVADDAFPFFPQDEIREGDILFHVFFCDDDDFPAAGMAADGGKAFLDDGRCLFFALQPASPDFVRIFIV